MKRLSFLWVLCLVLSACAPAATPPETTAPANLSSQPTTAVTTPETTEPVDLVTQPTPQASYEAALKEQEENQNADATRPTTPDCQHVDAGDDGKCDTCGANCLVIVDFYNLNDLHGKIADGENHPGVDELTTYFKRAKRTDQHAVFLSSGDMWQGSSESNLTKGLLTTDWMNYVGFSAMAIGNHEFDWGESPIKDNDKLAKFPILAINVYDRSTDKRVSYCGSSVMVTKGDVQIGIIGAVGDCYSSIAKDKVAGIYFKTGAALTQLVKNEATKLRQQGADYIVYLLHDGYSQSGSSSVSSITSSRLKSFYDIELSNGYVDLVFEGHTHKRYILKDEYGVYHMQAGGDNQGLSHIEVSINTANGNDSVRYSEIVNTGKYAAMDDDPIVQELLEKYGEDVSVGTDVLGTNARKRSSSELCQLTADLYYQKGVERWGDEYDIVLGGGFLSARSPYELAAGDVTYGMLYAIFPFDNDLVLCSVKGRDLRDKFFETDNDRYYISYGDYGKQVKANLDPNATYYIIVDSYTSVYAPNRLTEITRFDAKPYYARDMLAEYAAAGGFKK